LKKTFLLFLKYSSELGLQIHKEEDEKPDGTNIL
jgi:hypothetical protein